MKRPLLIHVVGITLCVVCIFVAWWYFIYAPLNAHNRMPLAIEQQQVVLVDSLDVISTTSIITLLVQAADNAGLEITACYSGEVHEKPAIVVHAHAQQLLMFLQFLELVNEQVPYGQCTQIILDKKQNNLDCAFYFMPLKRLLRERVISPAVFSIDPFCTERGCKLIAQCCCPDLGIDLKVKRLGDQITFE